MACCKRGKALKNGCRRTIKSQIKIDRLEIKSLKSIHFNLCDFYYRSYLDLDSFIYYVCIPKAKDLM